MIRSPENPERVRLSRVGAGGGNLPLERSDTVGGDAVTKLKWFTRLKWSTQFYVITIGWGAALGILEWVVSRLPVPMEPATWREALGDGALAGVLIFLLRFVIHVEARLRVLDDRVAHLDLLGDRTKP